MKQLYKVNPAIKNYSIDALNEGVNALFFKKGNYVSTETCKLSIVKHPDDGLNYLRVAISDGNHSRDFDRIDIVKDTSITLISLYYVMDQYRHGYSTMEIDLRF